MRTAGGARAGSSPAEALAEGPAAAAAKEPLNVLLVEDNPGDARIVEEALLGAEGAPYRLETVVRLSEGLQRVAKGGLDAILLDLNLPDSEGFETLDRLTSAAPNVPIVVFTVVADEAFAIEAVRRGAQDYVVKGRTQTESLRMVLRYAIDRNDILQQLRTSEQRLRSMLSAAPVVLFAVDGDGVFRLSEGRALEALGLRPGEVVGRSVFEVYRDVPGFSDHIRRALRGEEFTATIEVGEASFETRFTPIAGPEDEVGGVIGVATDITLARRAEAARRDAEDQHRQLESLRRLDRVRSEFINNAAHELSTPLTSIRLQMELLRRHREEGLSEQQRRSLEIADRGFNRLERLIHDLLRAAKLQAEALSLRREPIDLARLAQEAVEAAAPSAGRAGVELAFDARGAAVVQADPGRLGQVLADLLSNAVKFTPRGGSVAVHVEPRGDHVEVAVRDTGVGFSAAQRAVLFKPFSQAREAGPSREPGTGLGLYIAKGLVEAHGGSIGAESEGRGKGATFTFRIPREPAPAPAPGAEPG